jgi:hypothetical protein
MTATTGDPASAERERLAQERHGRDVSAAADRRAVRLIAITFVALAVGVGIESVRRQITGQHPDESTLRVVVALELDGCCA